jgi:hypothetical protein
MILRSCLAPEPSVSWLRDGTDPKGRPARSRARLDALHSWSLNKKRAAGARVRFSGGELAAVGAGGDAVVPFEGLRERELRLGADAVGDGGEFQVRLAYTEAFDCVNSGFFAKPTAEDADAALDLRDGL